MVRHWPSWQVGPQDHGAEGPTRFGTGSPPTLVAGPVRILMASEAVVAMVKSPRKKDCDDYVRAL